MTSRAIYSDSVLFSAYGERYYAFIVAPSQVVIYMVSTQSIVFEKEFSKELQQGSRQFTSLINFRSKFYAGLSDGTIFLFVKQKKKGNEPGYKYIDSKSDKLRDYNNFGHDTSKREIKLLGCNKQVLVYSTRSNKIVLLKRKHKRRSLSFDHPIDKVKINNKRQTLWLTTSDPDNIVLHKVSYKGPLNYLEVKIKLEEEGWELLDISKNGDIACQNFGRFIIYKPLEQKVPEDFYMGNSSWNSPELSCFIGSTETQFAYCSERSPAIGLAVCSGKWEDGECIGGEWEAAEHADEDRLERYNASREHGLQWNGSIRDIRSDGMNLVIRVQDRPHEIHNQPQKECLLIFKPDEEGDDVELSEPSYIPLDFRV